MAVRRRLDFIVLCETKLRDAILVRALAHSAAPGRHFRILSSCRPPSFGINGDLNPASGGILVLVFNPSLTIIDSWEDKRGILSFSARLPYTAPFACVCVYYPDAASPYSRWTDSLIEASAREIQRRRAVVGQLVFWVGDFNVRIGNFLRRITPDDKVILTRRARFLRRTLRALGMQPVHGRAEHLPAQFTSTQIAGQKGLAEVDFIVAPTALPADLFQVIPSPQWGSSELAPVGRGTHLPLFITVHLPVSAAYPGPAPRIRHRRPFSLPPYCDRKWYDIHSHIVRELPRALQTIYNPGTSLEECQRALSTLFRSAAIAVCGTGLPRTRTFKYRLYKGAPLPEEIVALFDLARHYRKRRKRAPNPIAREFYQIEADRAKHTAKTLAESFLKRFRDSLLSNLQRQMRIDPHGTHGFLRHLQGAEASNCADPAGIPAGPDGRPPNRNFSKSCRGLVTQTSALPAGATSPQWLSYVHHAPGGIAILRPFTAREIYPYLFPATSRHSPVLCHHACSICKQYAAEVKRWRPGSPFPTAPAPRHRGGLNTSRGEDLNNLVAELIRWVRPEAWGKRYNYRMVICSLLARFFNRMLATGTVPGGDFTRCVTSPLYKSCKPGSAPPPRWDVDAYRFITNSSVLAKAFSTLLASRLTHWVIRTGLLTQQQVAFCPFRGTEEHVFTLQQVLRERSRCGKKTFVLFVDFKKAYDSVHLDALWVVLERQGVPSHFVNLLRDWAAKRRTQVRVNGELSEPFRMSKGVPQGDPLSCLLYNLFTDSLSRYLKSCADIPGVTAFGGGITLQHQLYADDLTCLAESAAELQRALGHVKVWADAWGLSINTGTGKTEGMLADADSPNADPSQLQVPPLLLDDGREVRWTSTYRYLGYALRSDLRDTDAVDSMFKHLSYLWSVHFERNGVVRHASAAFQMQFYSTMVQGSLRNLRALTSLYAADIEALEKTLRRHISQIFALEAATPIDLISAFGAMLPWHAVHAQEHERLYLQLANPLYPDSIAARVFRLAQADHRIGASFAKRNWVRDWERKRAVLSRLGVPLAAPGIRHERIPIAAKRFGRAVAFVEWQKDGIACLDRPLASHCDADVAPSYRPTQAVANLFENYSAPVSSLGQFPEFTPLSTHGPGCSGSIPTRSNLPAARLGPIAWARTGAAVMRSPLFRLKGFEVVDYAAHASPCPLCGVTPVDTFHFVAECNHPSIDAWRYNFELDVRHFVVSLTQIMERERTRAGRPPDSWLFRRIRRAILNVDFNSHEGNFILYRLLVAQPWSERHSCPNMRAVRLLGRAFDLPGIYHRFERPILDLWCRWSLRWLWSLSRTWQSANLNGQPA